MSDDAAPQQQMLAVYGDSGLRAYGGFVTEEYLPELQGSRGLKTFRRMATSDATVAALIYAITALTRNVEFTVQAAGDEPAQEEAKTWLEGVIDDMDTPLDDVIADAATMYVYGFAPCEVTYKVRARKAQDADGQPTESKHDDGKLGVRSIALRAQTSLINWDIRPRDGAVLGLNQLTTWNGARHIPRKKLALFRCDAIKNNPESTSLLRPAYRAWFMKSRLEDIEAVGAERNNAGFPVIRIPTRFLQPTADPQEKAFASAMAELGKKIRRDQAEFALVASDVHETGASAGRPLIDIQLLTPGGKTFDIGAIIRRYDESIARSILAQFIFLGSTSAGSFALSSNQTDLFATALGAYVKRIAHTLTTDVVRVLWEANGFPMETMPKIVAGDLEKPDIGQLVALVSGLAGAGATVFPDRELENFLRKAGGLPLLPDDQQGQGADLGPQGAPGMADQHETEE